MGKWLAKYKNSPETPIQRTDNTDTAQVLDFQAEATKVKAHLQRHGIAKIRSATLDEDVFFAVDDKAAARAPRGAIVYELSELRELSRGPLTQDDLKQIHLTKKVFNGKIVQNSKNPFGSL